MTDTKSTAKAPPKYPSAGGRYVRQEDGSVIPAAEAAKAAAKTPKTPKRAGGDA